MREMCIESSLMLEPLELAPFGSVPDFTRSVTILMNIALFYRRDTHMATALIANP